MRALLNGIVVAESDATVMVEGNHYFPPDSVRWEYLEPSTHRSLCPWKGMASYWSVTAYGTTAPDGAWAYRDPSEPAARIRDHVAFWRGVEVAE